MDKPVSLRNQGYYHDFFVDLWGNLVELYGTTTAHEAYSYVPDAQGRFVPNTGLTFSRLTFDEANSFYPVYWILGAHPNGYDVTTAYWWGDHWQVVGSPPPTAAARKAHRTARAELPSEIASKVVEGPPPYAGSEDLQAKLVEAGGVVL